MTPQEIARNWLASNRKKIEMRGFEVSLNEYSGEVVAVVELISENLLAQIHIFNNGWVTCYGGTIQGEVDITPTVDDRLSTAENLDAMLEQNLSHA